MTEDSSVDIILREESWLSDRLQALEKIEDSKFQAICLYSLFESYAQEYNNYCGRDPFAAFRKYVLDFCHSSNGENNFLREYDPVSIYYEYQDIFEKGYDLSFMDRLKELSPDAIIATGIANKMIQELKNSRKRQDSEEPFKYYTFIGLLYKQRNKLSHEHYSPSVSLEHNTLKNVTEPRYHNVLYGNCKPDESLIATTGIWQFDFPLGYLKRLLCTCAINYHAYRKENLNTGNERSIPWTQKKPIKFKYKKTN